MQRTTITKLARVLSVSAIAAFSLAAVSSAKADPAPTSTPVVMSNAAGKADVTIYGTRGALIQQTRTIKLDVGHNRIQLNDIAAKYIDGSLRIVDASGAGKLSYQSATYQPANMSKEKLLQASLGQVIAITTHEGQAKGKLVSYSNGQLVIVDDTGAMSAVYPDTLPVVLPTPKGLSNTASLIVEADADKAGDYTISFMYETQGLGWTAKHSAVYDEQNNKFSTFESTVSVVNQSGTSFDNANVWLITGAAAQESSGRMVAYAAAAAPKSFDAGPGGAAIESVGEQKVYKLPGTISMADGQSRLVPLFTAEDVNVQREYFMSPQEYYGGYRQTPQKLDANVRLNFTNSKANHLGIPLPEGQFKVYQTNSAGSLQQVGVGRIPHLQPDEPFKLNIGTTSDIKVQTALTSVKPAPAPAIQPGMTQPRNPQVFEDQTYEVSVWNAKDKDTSVTLELNVPNQQDDVRPLIRDNADRAHASIKAPAGTTNTFSYTLRVQTQ